MECESLAALKPVLSYKDMVTGGNVSPQHDKLIDLDDDDTELFEEDISETCPKLHPSTQSDTDSMQHDVIPPLANAETNPPVDAADKVIVALNIPNSFMLKLKASYGEFGSAGLITSMLMCCLVISNLFIIEYVANLVDVPFWLPSHRKGCMHSARPDSSFISALFDSGLHDLGYKGPDYTLYKGNCAVQLDRCLCNDLWSEGFSETLVHHLLWMKSDHRPLLVSIGHLPSRRKKGPFRYFAGWLQHEDFHYLVVDNWDASLPITDAINNFTEADDSWNQLLEDILDHEELLWKQKLRSD
ncbi:hypothetical protein V6N13_029761 [Hibiscus sabdariffa]